MASDEKRDEQRSEAPRPRDLCDGCRAVQPGPHSPGCEATSTTPERHRIADATRVKALAPGETCAACGHHEMTKAELDAEIERLRTKAERVRESVLRRESPTPVQPCCTCSHLATSHAVDDEERRECRVCGCKQYEDAAKVAADEACKASESLTSSASDDANRTQVDKAREWLRTVRRQGRGAVWYRLDPSDVEELIADVRRETVREMWPEHIIALARKVVDAEMRQRRECHPGTEAWRRSEMGAARSHWIDQLQAADSVGAESQEKTR